MENTEPKIDLTYASSIENVDFAMFDWLDKSLNLSCTTKDGFKKVPVIWVTPERAYQIKQNKELRDINGTINIPLMTIERTNIMQTQKDSATYYNNLPPKDNRQIISRRINQKKSSEFANADYQKKYGYVQFARPKKNEKVVYEFKSMLLPVYATFTYSISIFTQFQQQMNEIVQPFITKTGSRNYFIVERDGYKYECFIEPSFESKNNIASMEEEERRYITTITIKVIGNLVSDGANQEDSVIKVFENAVELKIPKDSLMVQNYSTNNKIQELEGQNFYIQSNNVTKKVFVIGNSSDTLYILKHELGTRNLYVTIRENFGAYSSVSIPINFTTQNEIQINLPDNLKGNSYTVTVIG